MSDFEPIEVFTGRTVHKVIEIHSKNEIKNSKDAIYAQLESTWASNWHANISPQESEEKYKKHALNCLDNYYTKYGSQTSNETIRVEQKLFGKIGGETMTGIIDRLEMGETYKIIDYKTGEIPNEAFFATDWQLALYSLLITQSTKLNPNNITLEWEYLSIPKTVKITKNQPELDELTNQIEDKLNKIKTSIKSNNFPKTVTEKCQKCEYYQVSCDGKQETQTQAITLNSWM